MQPDPFPGWHQLKLPMPMDKALESSTEQSVRKCQSAPSGNCAPAPFQINSAPCTISTPHDMCDIGSALSHLSTASCTSAGHLHTAFTVPAVPCSTPHNYNN